MSQECDDLDAAQATNEAARPGLATAAENSADALEAAMIVDMAAQAALMANELEHISILMARSLYGCDPSFSAAEPSDSKGWNRRELESLLNEMATVFKRFRANFARRTTLAKAG